MVKHNTDTNGIGYEWEYAKVKDDRTVWQKIIMGIYNPSSHEFLGRSAKSWGGILLFYAVFYSSLAFMFAICMKILLITINEHTPHFTLTSSLIGDNPGLGFRPMSPNIEDGSLIYFQGGNLTNVQIWTKQLDKFLAVYKNKTLLKNQGANQITCSHNMASLQKNKVCDVSLADMGECTSEHHYGYLQSRPCVFIKLNKIFDWNPDFYSKNDLDSNTYKEMTDIPKHLYNIIKTAPDAQMNTIWVTCHGETPADRESIGELELFPKDMNGFPGYYYPFTNEPDYLSPIIAVHFKNPKRNTLINVECRAWAKNIKYRRSLQNREGSVHFELMID